MSRILIVDDEEIGRTVMEDIFGRYGQSVSVATGKGALHVYQTAIDRGTPFDLVLLDISLEDISGLEVLKKIRAIDQGREGKKAVIIMVTAHSEKELVVGSIKGGCKAYFIKPLKQETVDGKMAELGFSPVDP